MILKAFRLDPTRPRPGPEPSALEGVRDQAPGLGPSLEALEKAPKCPEAGRYARPRAYLLPQALEAPSLS